MPNLNWSGGTSRPRYYLLRGVGELEQYQGAPNPSVGFLIDGIDFSGVGMPATHVRRGAGRGAARSAGHTLRRQRAGRARSTRIPAIRDREPELDTELTAGQDGMWAAGLVGRRRAGRRATDRGAWRFAVQQAQSDGFRHNVYLGRDDTNGRDELTRARQAARCDPAPGWQVGLTRACTPTSTTASTPSRPTTRSTRCRTSPARMRSARRAARSRFAGDLGARTLQGTTAYADSDIVYSFDGDWGNDDVLGRVRAVRLFLALRPRAPHAEPGPALLSQRDGARRGVRLARWASTRCASTRTTASATSSPASCCGRCSTRTTRP